MIAYSYVFILLTLASGYTSLKLAHATKYRINKYSGQELFFSSAVTGLLVFCLGYVICGIAECLIPSYMTVYSTLFGDNSIMHAVTGWLLSLPIILFIVNKIISNDYSISKYIDEQNDGIERLLDISQIETKPIIVTLSTRKVYIGVVTQSFFSPIENKSFTILPLYSGYRDSETQKFIRTNKYYELISEYEESGKLDLINDFVVAISIDSIISINIFNNEIYNEMINVN